MNALETVDLGEDGRISPDDFGSWFANGANPTGRGGPDEKRLGLGLSTLVRPDVEHPGEGTQLSGDMEHSRAPALWGDQLKRHGHSMMRARKLLCLDCFNITDLMEMLAEVEVAVSFGNASPNTPWVSAGGTWSYSDGIRTHRELFEDCFRHCFGRRLLTKAACYFSLCNVVLCPAPSLTSWLNCTGIVCPF